MGWQPQTPQLTEPCEHPSGINSALLSHGYALVRAIPAAEPDTGLVRAGWFVIPQPSFRGFNQIYVGRILRGLRPTFDPADLGARAQGHSESQGRLLAQVREVVGVKHYWKNLGR